MVLWVWESETVSELKNKIKYVTSFPAQQKSLIYSGRALQETSKLKEYQLQRNVTIFLNLRLRSGLPGTTSTNISATTTKGMHSFKEILKGKSHTQGKKQTPDPSTPGPYLVEKTENIPNMEV